MESVSNSEVCKKLKEHVFSGMSSSEEIMKAVLNDKAIDDLGNMLCLKFGKETQQQKNLVRAKLLRLAKVRLGNSWTVPSQVWFMFLTKINGPTS